MFWADRDRGHVNMAKKHVAVVLDYQPLQIAHDSRTLCRLNELEGLAAYMVSSPMRFPRRDFEQHVVLQDVHVGGAGDICRHPFWGKTRNSDGESTP